MFNLIIPYHNPSIKEVDRLFRSLTRQCISYKIFKVIVVDDNSDNKKEYQKYISDNFISIGMDVEFVSTSTTIHCPGNTRRAGMDYLDPDAEWLCFCDQDDYFEDGAFANVIDYIKKNDSKETPIYVVSTIMVSYNQEKNESTKEFKHEQAWLHGKFYNIPKLIKKYNINFKKDLITHEDVYFNSLIIAKIFELGVDFNYFDIITYRWVENPESLTRKEYNDRGYFYENFNDYVCAASEPYWEGAKDKTNLVFVNQVMMTILHCYFYYEAASYYNGPYEYKDVLNCIVILLKKAQEELNYDLDFIVDFLYEDPVKFSLVLENCELCSGKFICKTSLRDFIYKAGTMELI